MKKHATAFAPARTGGGQSLGWESLVEEEIPEALTQKLPIAVSTAAPLSVVARTILPVNVSRGTLTMLRVRGTIEIYFGSAELASSLDNWFVHMTMQVVPARLGAIDTTSILTPNNANDQESNKIIWQRSYYPRAGTTITSPGALEVHESTAVGMEVDVKVKRRFERSNWALALVAQGETAAIDVHLCALRLRALFQSADGI